jgi:aryl-alcohol dehydrogenase-like predicted oxidoreductase
LGIGFVAYSPLGRGFLTGQYRIPDDLPPNDHRRDMPRFQGDNLRHNLMLVEQVEEMAAERGCTPAQIALAWVLAQGDDIIPIPGTKRRAYLEENLDALTLDLTRAELQHLDAVAPQGVAAGTRYPQAMMGLLNK